MLTEWDPGKARLNVRKHGISFADAVASLEDEGALTMRDPFSDDEERWVTMGRDVLGRVLVVVYTWRGESVRLISARKATARERRRYEDVNETRI
ncbi:MAG: BrnT family toxin [Acidobacteria bacterium]|nr:BrnT family toxin [Acidobacteriota bacterium]